MVRTGFGADDQQPLWKLAAPVIRPFTQSPTKAAVLPVHLASAPDLQNTTGAYFVGARQRRSSDSSYDEKAAATLWHISADLNGSSAKSPTDRRVSHLHPGGALRFATVDLGAARGRRRRRRCRTEHTAERLPDADARHPETMVA
jgi:hypothetical protein